MNTLNTVFSSGRAHCGRAQCNQASNRQWRQGLPRREPEESPGLQGCQSFFGNEDHQVRGGHE